MKSHKPTYYLALFATAFALVVIILGAYTRLKDAGLGCPDWPGCYGFMWMPESPEDIIAAEELYPHAPFERDKAWPEVVHRYFAGTLGVLILILAVKAYQLRRQPEQPLTLPMVLLGLVIVQAAFGMWTVTLNLWPQIVTAHLMGGFATLSLLWLLCLRLDNSPWPQPAVPLRQWARLRPLAMGGLILVILQIILGGWVSSNYAALACPDLPTCQNRWWPEMNFARGFNFFQEIGPNYLGGQLDADARVAIHMGHRIGALIVVLYMAFLLVKLYRNSAGTPLGQLANGILALLVIQVSLGLSNILFGLPLVVAVAHNAVGALLLLSLITLNYRLNRATSGIP